jgi:glycosyltransferase involved in cell wall biosynthesis
MKEQRHSGGTVTEYPAEPRAEAAAGFAGEPRAVLYLHSSDDLYGADMILLQLVTRLDRGRYRPIVILPEDMKHVGLLSHELAAAGIEHHHLPIAILRRRDFSPIGIFSLLRRLIAGTWGVRRLVRRYDDPLLHGFTLAVIAAPLAAFWLRLPLLMHVHEIILQPRFLRKFLHTLATRSANRVLCVSDAVRANILEDEPRSAEKVVVIHNGISGPPAETLTGAELRRSLRRDLGVPEEIPLVGMVGRVSAWKGQEVFVRAASLLRRQSAPCHFVAIGGVFDGETKHMDRLRAVVEESQVGDTLTLVGFRKNARRYMPAFDVFVLPSTLPEPFGTVILEAMAAGVPVIASAHGGPREMIVEGETGLLVPPGDAETLAAAVRALLDDPERARRMGQAGQAYFNSHFLLQRYVSEIEQLYSTLGGTPRTRVS